MLKNKSFKYLITIIGFTALFITGYTATSVITSCPAEALTCCNATCVTPLSGLTVALALATSIKVLPAIAITVVSAAAYYGAAILNFTAQIINRIGTIIDHWISWWDTLAYYNILPALQDMTDQLTLANMGQARAIGAFIDMTGRQRAERNKIKQEILTHRAQRPGENVCVAGTVMGGMVSAQTFTRAYNTAAPIDMLRRSSNDTRKPSANSTAADISQRYALYTSKYCNPNENGGNSPCSGSSTSPSAGLDLDIPGQIFERDTIDIRDPEVRQTINDIVANIAEPVIMNPQPKSTLQSSSGTDAFLTRESIKAKRQVIYDSLYHVIARRIPGASLTRNGSGDEGLGAMLSAMRQEAGIDTSQISDNPSRNEIMQVMLNDRYRTGRYALRQIDEPENNVRELAIQAKLETMQLMDILDLMDRHSILIASRVSDSINKASIGKQN